MIAAGSRYSNSTVVPATSLAGKDILAILFSQPTDKTFSFIYHQVTTDDKVDVLAYNFYNDPTLWWVIANANPEIVNWTVLTPGSLLRIPSLASALT